LKRTAAVFWREEPPVKAYEFGLNQRLVIIEFESVQKAIEAY
jgi:hypothetical protein